jgi:hypothetical protein
VSEPGRVEELLAQDAKEVQVDLRPLKQSGRKLPDGDLIDGSSRRSSLAAK